MLAATVAVLPVYAGELNPDPQAKIGPPIGAPAAGEQSQVRILPPSGAPVTSQNRILPPIGTPAPALSPLDLFWLWLQAQVKISPPIG
ncbi:MAG TPA: hypothetical protein VF432_13440 [Thermoanaerobaculia bacterium]